MKSDTGEFTEIFWRNCLLNASGSATLYIQSYVCPFCLSQASWIFINVRNVNRSCRGKKHFMPFAQYIFFKSYSFEISTQYCADVPESFCTYFQALNPDHPHATKCIYYFMNNFPSKWNQHNQATGNRLHEMVLESALQDCSWALKSQRRWRNDPLYMEPVYLPPCSQVCHYILSWAA